MIALLNRRAFHAFISFIIIVGTPFSVYAAYPGQCSVLTYKTTTYNWDDSLHDGAVIINSDGYLFKTT